MRCLTLADELRARECELRFIAAAAPVELVDRIERAGHELRPIEPSDRGADAPGWDSSTAGPDEQRADAAATLEALGGWRADWLVVDHYRFDEHWQREVRRAGARLLVIDDLANRRHDCDILVDHTVGREAGDYRRLVPGTTELLLGSSYALLRPEFAAVRHRALQRRRSAGSERLLLTLGSTDVDGLTAKVLDSLVAQGIEASIDVVLGSAATPSFERTTELAREHSRIAVHCSPPSMAELMARADLAIGAAGTTSWERCCLGLPSVTLVVADNQRTIARNLEQAGAITVMPDWTAVAGAVRELLADSLRLQQMSAAAATLVDGHGAQRVAAAMLEDSPASTAGTRGVR
jgi:UDP-2,4-diacetamido-2,4,6-trideoxy-beta-L-altropyranose hydrolase